MATEEDQVKRITNNIEEAYQALRRVAANISGLLAVGRATCDEVKAYNLWALAIYDAQRGMLAHLRAQGDKNVPELPNYPTLFAWKGVSGENAYKIDCARETSSLSDALSAALASTAQPDTKFLSSNEIRIVTSDPHVFTPGQTPSLVELTQTGMNVGLGNPVLIIVIAAISIALVATAIVALSRYLQERNIQEQTTERTMIQAKAFENYTAARMSCYSSCMNKPGATVDACIRTCKTLVDKPKLDVTPRSGLTKDSSLGVFGTVGLIVVAGLGGVVVLRLYKKGYFNRFKASDEALPEGA
jgi:hypothetical protein